MAETTKKATETKNQRAFKVLEKKIFNGFMHPKTRKFITADADGVFKVDEADDAAIAILENASDVTDVTSMLK